MSDSLNKLLKDIIFIKVLVIFYRLIRDLLSPLKNNKTLKHFIGLYISEQNNIFLINYLRGFIKYRFSSLIEQMPKYLITDIFNLNPFQRRIWREKCCNIFISSGLKKENLIKTILSSIERIIRQKPDLGESIQIFIELFRIIIEAKYIIE